MISYILIGLSIIVSLVVWQNKHIFSYGMSRVYIEGHDYKSFAKQVGLFQFIHGDILHLVMNSYFLYAAGPSVERLLGIPGYIGFFLFSTLISVIGILLFAKKSNTIGISGFCMALLGFLWISLYSIGDPGAIQVGTLLAINIAFGLAPGISFAGHLLGAVAGGVFWLVLFLPF